MRYELIDLLAGVFFLSIIILVIGQKTQNEFIQKNSFIFIFLFATGFLWLIIRLFVGKLKKFEPIIKTGEIEFNIDFVICQGKEFKVEEIRKIRIDAMYCKGLPSGGGMYSGLSDGTGNSIEFFLKNNYRLKEKFVIENIKERENLKSLMDNWKQRNVLIIGDWKPFLHIFQK